MIWQRREWINVHQEGSFQVFMVESTLVWCTRLDPNDYRNKSCVAWPALVSTPAASKRRAHFPLSVMPRVHGGLFSQTFVALVDRVGLDESKPKPVEYLVDRELTFRVYSRLKPFHVSIPLLPVA